MVEIHRELPSGYGRSNITVAKLERLYSDAQPRDPHGRWAPGGSSDGGGGGGGGKKDIPPITADEARGDSRPVSAEEFQQIASEGQSYLDNLRKNQSPPDGLTQNWEQIKTDAYAHCQESWGGATYDAHTGEITQPTSGYALSIKSHGNSVSVPENASREKFDTAMDQARIKFRDDLSIQDGQLGVFHDNDLHRIDIDPVLKVPGLHEVETVGAATHAVGGAYSFADGNGYWPPHVAEEAKAARSGVHTFAAKEPQHWRGIGEWYANVRKTQHKSGSPNSAADLQEFYSDAQPRDPNGRWAPGGPGDSGGGGGGGKGPIPDAEAQKNMQRVMDQDKNLDQDAAWYQQQHDLIGERAAAMGIEPDTFAGMVAATSPQCPWKTATTGRLMNIELAEKAGQAAKANPGMDGKTLAQAMDSPGMLRNSLASAIDIYNGKSADQVLKGPKVRSFYNNLTNPGHTDSVTIDTHMIRAIMNDRSLSGQMSKGTYKWAADQVRAVAKARGMSPDAVQAVVWSQWRRGS